MNKKLRFIQVGTGGFGARWCEGILPYIVNELNIAELVGAVDVNPVAHQNAIKYTGLDAFRCYTDLRTALEEQPCDFVVIVLPAHLHEYAVDLALEYNCHILMEKPISDTIEGSCRIYHKVKRANRNMAITISHRFDQDKQTLQRLLQSRQYGKLHYLIGRFTTNNRAAVSNPREYAHHHFLISSAVHQLDILRALAGSNAKTVYTQSWNPDWAPFKEHSTALISIEMENGVRALYEGSKSNAVQLNGWLQDYYRAECELASLELDHRQLTVRSDLGFPYPNRAEVPLLEQRSWTHRWLMEMFIAWLQGGEAPPNSLDDNLQGTALQFAAIESGLTGKVIDVQTYLQNRLEVADKELG
jgi:predicted dehydrogenase